MLKSVQETCSKKVKGMVTKSFLKVAVELEEMLWRIMQSLQLRT